jgi:hypothetical protein
MVRIKASQDWRYLKKLKLIAAEPDSLTRRGTSITLLSSLAMIFLS